MGVCFSFLLKISAKRKQKKEQSAFSIGLIHFFAWNGILGERWLVEHMKSSWFKMLSEEKNKMNTTDLEFSALVSWVLDCQESFQRIYKELLPKIDNIDPVEKEALHDVVFDIYFELKHIGNHINDSENGFLALLKALSCEQRHP